MFILGNLTMDALIIVMEYAILMSMVGVLAGVSVSLVESMSGGQL